jgi:hypothetical protein
MEELAKQLELLNKSVNTLNDSLKTIINKNEVVEKNPIDSEYDPVINYEYICCDSTKIIKNVDGYFVVCEFLALDDDFVPALNTIIEDKKSIGVIYGEYEPVNNFSLSRASHTIDDIEIEEFDRIGAVNVTITCKMMNTQYGKKLKRELDDDTENYFYLTFTRTPVIKIFTINVKKDRHNI